MEDDNDGEARGEFKFLGVTLGTYDGWDDAGPDAIQIYGFVPAEGINLPEAATLVIAIDTGVVHVYKEGALDDNPGEVHDMLTVLSKYVASERLKEWVK